MATTSKWLEKPKVSIIDVSLPLMPFSLSDITLMIFQPKDGREADSQGLRGVTFCRIFMLLPCYLCYLMRPDPWLSNRRKLLKNKPGDTRVTSLDIIDSMFCHGISEAYFWVYYAAVHMTTESKLVFGDACFMFCTRSRIFVFRPLLCSGYDENCFLFFAAFQSCACHRTALRVFLS